MESEAREWQLSRSAIGTAMVGGAVVVAWGLVLLVGSLDPGQARLVFGTAFPLASIGSLLLTVALVRRSRHPLFQVAAIMTVTMGLIPLFFRSPLSWSPFWILLTERSLALGAILFGGVSLVTLLRRLRAPIVLRLTSTGIERSGYARSTPPIPYEAIARVDTLPDFALGLTLRDGFARPSLGRTLRGYDVAIGHDVGARIPDLRDRLAARLPDDVVVSPRQPEREGKRDRFLA